MRKIVKRAVVLMMVFSILPGILPSLRCLFVKAAVSNVIWNDETGIPDKNLYQLILNELGKTPNSIFTENEARKVEKLTQDKYEDRTEEEKISSLQGIEKLTNLRSIYLGKNNITDVKPLGSLRNLTLIDLQYSRITSIEDLRNLIQLESINLPSTIKDLSPIEGMIKLSSLGAVDANISTLPDLTKHKELTAHNTYLHGNNLTKKELTKKLPKQVLKEKNWLTQTIDLQNYNVKKKLNVTSPKKVTKITSKTKKIVGKTDKNLWVGLYYYYANGETLIKRVKADKNGAFKMRNLDLKKYKKKNLTLKSFYINDYYFEEEWDMKTLTFKLK